MATSLDSILAQPFADADDPRGFWLLLVEHIEHLQVRNYATTTIRIRAYYVRVFARWCLERDVAQPAQVGSGTVDPCASPSTKSPRPRSGCRERA